MPRILQTSRFGALTVDESDIINFPRGVPGFENHREWALAGEDDNPVKWLQSLSDGDVALPVVVPLDFFPDYHITLTRADLVALQCGDAQSLAMLVVVTIPVDRPWDATANLRAPVVVNPAKRVARQIILDDEELSLQTPLLADDQRESLRDSVATVIEKEDE